MKMIIGGAVAFLLGIYGIIVFSTAFFDLVLAVVPATLILAGGLMVYLNRDCLIPEKDQNSVDDEPEADEPVAEESVVEEPSAEELAVTEPAPEEVIVEEPPANEFQFVGNTDSKVFHTQDCKFAESKKCTDFFAKKEDAVQADYKPCSICKP